MVIIIQRALKCNTSLYLWMFCTHLPLKGCHYKLKSVYHSSRTGEAVYHYAEVESKPIQSASHDYQTIEPDSAHQENQPQYEVPVPQQHNKSNEVGKMETV